MRGNWTALVVNYNGATFLDACLISLQQQRLRPGHVIVVDNASTDDSLQELHGFPFADTLPQRENLGYAGGANAGLRHVETDYVVILNPDVELAPDFGQVLVETFDANARLGAAGALLLYPDERTIQHAGGIVTRPSLFTDHRGRGEPLSAAYEQEMTVDFATGAALCLRMQAIREVGGFDEQFSPAYYEDVDLCARLASSGWEVRYVPALRGLHFEGVTLQRSPEYFAHIHRNRLRYALKHLTPTEWHTEFVPAEITRLRHELKEATDDDWPGTTGAGAVDSLLRAVGDRDDWKLESLLSTSAFPSAQYSTEDLGALLSRTPPFAGGNRSLFGKIGFLLNGLPTWYLRRALRGQVAFNQAVTQALIQQDELNRQQDRFNREQTATTLLFAILALDSLGRHRARVPAIRTPDELDG